MGSVIVVKNHAHCHGFFELAQDLDKIVKAENLPRNIHFPKVD